MSFAGESIGVIGGGYVGLVTGACFAALGLDVTIVETDEVKLSWLRAGKSPIFESGLTELLNEGASAGRLRCVASVAQLKAAKPAADIFFIAVGTPQRDDGSCDLSYLETAVDQVLAGFEGPSVIVLKSTVPVGTARRLAAAADQKYPGRGVRFVNNPEFLKEGSAIQDFMKPDRVLIGTSDTTAATRVKSLYEPLLNNGHPVFVTDHETAELAKLASNLMLASRISLVNQVSRLSDEVGADMKQVEAVMRADTRIGSKYLYSGLGYGGSCFPKDVRSFIHQCESRKIDASMARSVDAFNETQKLVFVDRLTKRTPKGGTITLLGVAFKPNTDDIRDSPALALTKTLVAKGFQVRTFDPKASPNFEAWLKTTKLAGVEIVDSLDRAFKGTDALVLVTEWQEFQRLDPRAVRKLVKAPVIFDGKNVLRPGPWVEAGFEYIGVGRRSAS